MGSTYLWGQGSPARSIQYLSPSVVKRSLLALVSQGLSDGHDRGCSGVRRGVGELASGTVQESDGPGRAWRGGFEAVPRGLEPVRLGEKATFRQAPRSEGLIAPAISGDSKAMTARLRHMRREPTQERAFAACDALFCDSSRSSGRVGAWLCLDGQKGAPYSTVQIGQSTEAARCRCPQSMAATLSSQRRIQVVRTRPSDKQVPMPSATGR